MGFYLDGRVSLVVGTHTHVPTADTQIMPKGTAYVTDLGMTGPLHSVIGMEPEPVIARFITGMPHRYKTAVAGSVTVNAILADLDEESGRAFSIRRLDTVVESASIYWPGSAIKPGVSRTSAARRGGTDVGRPVSTARNANTCSPMATGLS